MTGLEMKEFLRAHSSNVGNLWRTVPYHIYDARVPWQKMDAIARKYEDTASVSAADEAAFNTAKMDFLAKEKVAMDPPALSGPTGIAAGTFTLEVEKGTIPNPFILSFADAAPAPRGPNPDVAAYSKAQLLATLKGKMDKMVDKGVGHLPAYFAAENAEKLLNALPERFSLNQGREALNAHADAIQKMDAVLSRVATSDTGKPSRRKAFSDVQKDVARQFGFTDEAELAAVYSGGDPVQPPQPPMEDVVSAEAKALIERLKGLVDSAGDELSKSEKRAMEEVLDQLMEAVPALEAAIGKAKDLLDKAAPAMDESPSL